MRVRLRQDQLVAFLAQSRLSQNHWAIKLGLSRGHWSEIVNGKHSYPSPKTRERMVEVLGLRFEDLFEVETETQQWADVDFRRAIADRYLIDAEIGQGGMGAVYLARDTRHGRVVAIKVIAPEAVSGIGINQFLREIATVAQLQHPHILPLFDSGEVAGHPFYVMPYIRGGSLRAKLQAAIRLPVDEAAALTAGIASALQHAHEQRILHCDVKPENILLDGSHPYVMDFGVARKLHTEVLPWIQRRELDLSAGTPAYVSPEQASGEKDLDTRSDVYSLACVVYEILTGRPPFEGTTTQAVVSRRFVAPPPPMHEFAPEVPLLLEEAVERAMELEPRRRTASPKDFAAAIAETAKPVSGGLARLSTAVTRGMSRLRRSGPGVTTRFGSLGMETLLQDIRHAARSLRHSPAFATVVALTLALGIGANTAIFSVVRGVLLKPLPHKDGDRLMYLRHSMDGTGGENINFSVPEVRDIRTGATSFAGIAEYSSFSMIYQGEEGAERLATGLVTGNYFEVMGLSPVVGRLTLPSDDGPGVPPVVVLTHQYWMKRFGGDPGVVGRRLTLDRRSVEVIGVLQPAPFFPNRIDILANMVNSEHHLGASMVEGRSHRMTEVVARLATGATLQEATAQVATVNTRLSNEFTDAYPPGTNHRFAVIPFRDVLGERAQLTLWLLMGAAAFVMIISAASVANLSLMRGVRREHELVVRAALGAGVSRLRRLLLVENMLLALLGAAAGMVIAVGGVRLLSSFAARYSTRAGEIRLDSAVFMFAFGLSVAVALLLSFLATLPKEGGLASRILTGARMTGGLGRHRLQRGLVVLQVAVSVVLLAGAGLLTRTMIRLSEVDTGLMTEEVLTMSVNNLLTRAESRDTALVAAVRQRINVMREEIAGLPGIIDVGIGTAPLRNTEMVRDIMAEGRPLAVGEVAARAELRSADHDYFRAAGIPLQAGRVFTTTDRAGSFSLQARTAPVIINRRLADRLFPGEDALGKRIAWTDGTQPVFGEWSEVVGVVGNTQDGGLDAQQRGVIYLQAGQFGGSFVIRAERNVADQAAAVRRIIQRIAPTALIENVLTIPQIKDLSLSPRRLNAVLVSSFGILAMIIAAVGIAGVLAFSVSARTNEIGIRMSLGADGGRVQRMILWEGGSLVVAGLTVGLGTAIVASQAIRGLLFGVEPNDPITFGSVALLMTAIGIVGCWIPARRAARIDPAITMRSD